MVLDIPMRLLNISSSSALPLHFASSTTASAQPTCSHFINALPITNFIPFPQDYTSDTRIPGTNQPNLPPKPKTIRYRLSQLCREGQIHIARQLFDDIPKPTTVVWNAMLIGYICNDLHLEAISLYAKMKTCGGFYKVEPDPYTFSSVLKACAEVKDIRVGKAVHGHVLRSSIFPGRIVHNSLLNMYVSCLNGLDDLASFSWVERVFNGMAKRNVIAWNTMISWYCKMEKPVEALLKFVKMMKMGIQPTVVSFINVFPAASRIGDSRVAGGLFGVAVKMGKDYVDDLYVVSSVISMYAELGCMGIARRIFNNCFDRNTEILNTTIGGYVHNSCPAEALNLFLEALDGEGDVSLDDVTFLSAIAAASQLRNLEFVQQLYAYAIKHSMISSITIANACISMYSKCNSVADSFQIFSEMQARDLVSWNSIISALVQNGMNDEALMLVYEMQNQGFMVDAVTITSILSAASNLGHQGIGKQTHACILRRGIQFEGMNTYLIDMYAKSGNTYAAEKVFKLICSSDGDPAIWNAMISAYTQNGFVEQSFTIFREMLERNVMPTSVTLASILPACSHSGSLSNGKACHAFILRQFMDCNVFLSSALVDMYSKTGAVHYAESVFRSSAEKNSVTYTNMILGYGQHGMGDKAVALFNSWKEIGYESDGITHLAALSACCHAGLVGEGLQIFQSLNTDGLQPSLEHYACIVDMLGRVGRVVEAYEILKDLDNSGNTLGIWGSLLAACTIHGYFGLGKVVADKLLHMTGGHMRPGYHVLLSNIYAAEGNWKLVNRVRSFMANKRLPKDVGCSWIDISGYTYTFVSKIDVDVSYSVLYDNLRHLTAHMKDAGYTPSMGFPDIWISELAE